MVADQHAASRVKGDGAQNHALNHVLHAVEDLEISFVELHERKGSTAYD